MESLHVIKYMPEEENNQHCCRKIRLLPKKIEPVIDKFYDSMSSGRKIQTLQQPVIDAHLFEISLPHQNLVATISP